MTVENDILRYRYQGCLEHAKGYSPKTVDSHLRAIVVFDQFQRGRDFGTITTDQIISFRKHLLEKSSEATGNELSASTMVHTLGALKDFFHRQSRCWSSAWSPEQIAQRLKVVDAAVTKHAIGTPALC
ncbi:MAG: phage integrase N-terminal SAM-like domain-containing protein [Candidatus Kaistia colombiensis]|nr:MAG: phage integrase N-terminal SAM-like domain-containing protein [Kaistia sp.]